MLQVHLCSEGSSNVRIQCRYQKHPNITVTAIYLHLLVHRGFRTFCNTSQPFSILPLLLVIGFLFLLSVFRGGSNHIPTKVYPSIPLQALTLQSPVAHLISEPIIRSRRIASCAKSPQTAVGYTAWNTHNTASPAYICGSQHVAATTSVCLCHRRTGRTCRRRRPDSQDQPRPQSIPEDRGRLCLHTRYFGHCESPGITGNCVCGSGRLTGGMRRWKDEEQQE